MPPQELLAVGQALRRWGASPAAGIVSSAARRPDDVALIDELGELTLRRARPPLELARAGR